MRITREKIESVNLGANSFNNFIKYYPDFDGDLQAFINLEYVTYSDKVCAVTRLFTRQQNIRWSILCAEPVLHLFEEKYPNDKRPREAIKAAKNVNTSVTELLAAMDAAKSAAMSTAKTTICEAVVAAYFVAWSVYAASDSAFAVWKEWSVGSAIDTVNWVLQSTAGGIARNAVNAVVNKKEQEDKNLSFMLMCEGLNENNNN